MLLDRGLAVLLFLLVLAVFFPVVPWLIPLLVGTGYGLLRKRHRCLANTLVLLSLAVVLSHQLHRISEKRLMGRLGDPVSITGVIRQAVVEDRYVSVDLLQASVREYGGERLTFPGTFRVILSGTGGYGSLRPGDRLTATGQLRMRRVYRNPGTDRTGFYRARKQLFYVSVSSPLHVGSQTTFVGNLIRVAAPFHIGLPDPPVSVLKAMVAGDRDALPEPFRQRVRELGIYHLFVVSGFHFGIFFSAAYLLLLLLPIRTRYRKALALIALVMLLPMTGFSAPSVRAFLMIFLYLLFSLRDIRIPPADAVGLAGILLLIWNPWQAVDPGFLLSFLVSGGIVVSLKADDRWWQIMLRVPVVAFLVSLPVMVGWFGQVPLTAPLVNLLVSPVVTVVFYLFLLVQVQLPLVGFLDSMVTGMLWMMDHLPAFQVNIMSATGALIGLTGVAMFLTFPGRWRWRGLAAGTVLMLVVALVPRGHRSRMVVPDTGQSQAVLIQHGGQNWLFDAAGEWEARLGLIPRLRSLGVRRIDGLFLSHFDLDHAGGVPELVRAFPVDRVYATDAGGAGTSACRVRSVLAERRIPIQLLNRSTPVLTLDRGVTVRVVHPAVTPVPSGPGNQRSLGIELTVDGSRICLLGDLDGEALVRTVPELSQADILIAPHHGSRRAAVPELAGRVNPSLVVVCCGRNNRYHFPSPDFQSLFQNVAFRTTAAEGEIQISLENGPNH